MFEALSVDLEGLRAVIVTGHGDEAFCAGGDLKERNGMSDESWQAQQVSFERVVRAMMGATTDTMLSAGSGYDLSPSFRKEADRGHQRKLSLRQYAI